MRGFCVRKRWDYEEVGGRQDVGDHNCARGGHEISRFCSATSVAIVGVLLFFCAVLPTASKGRIRGSILGVAQDGGSRRHELGEDEHSSSGTKLVILHVNDHHSHLDQSYMELNGDHLPQRLSIQKTHGKHVSLRLRAYIGGYPRLVRLMTTLSSRYEAGGTQAATNVLKLHAGDALSGTPYYTLFDWNGEADADVMGTNACFDAMEVGNHEFDDGDGGLARFVRALRDGSSAACPNGPTVVLGANVRPGADSPLRSLVEGGQFRRSFVRRFSGGDDAVGVVGIEVRNTTMFNSFADTGTVFLDEVQTARDEIDALTKQGVDKIVILSHVGYEYDIKVLAELDGVDVIVGGHSHTLLGTNTGLDLLAPLPRDRHARGETPPYPTIVTRTSDGGKVCVVQAYHNAMCLGALEVAFDSVGNVRSCGGDTLVPFDPTRFTVLRGDNEASAVLSPDDSAVVASYLEDLGSVFVGVSEDEATAATLGKYSVQVDVLRRTVIVHVEQDICNERVPGEGRSEVCSAEETKLRGGGVGNLVARSFLEGTKVFGTDLALVHAAYCRTDIVRGDFTVYDAHVLLPFAGGLVTLEVLGSQLVQAIEDAIDFVVARRLFPSYPYGSGIRFCVDTSAPKNRRLHKVEVNRGMLHAEWGAIERKGTYTVVTPALLATGRAGYDEFAKVGESEKNDTLLGMTQTFVDYVQNQGVLRNLPVGEYSTQSYR